MKKQGMTPEGQSKYALKVARRKRYARGLGVADAPWPVLLRGFDTVDDTPDDTGGRQVSPDKEPSA